MIGISFFDDYSYRTNVLLSMRKVRSYWWEATQKANVSLASNRVVHVHDRPYHIITKEYMCFTMPAPFRPSTASILKICSFVFGLMLIATKKKQNQPKRKRRPVLGFPIVLIDRGVFFFIKTKNGRCRGPHTATTSR